MSNLSFYQKPGDRYGFYQIGSINTYSRYQLIDIHHRLPQSWKWIYNDDFFGLFDWSKEPKKTLEQLYRERAAQLRQDNDYLILFYSGGYDSSNMLHAFLDNNIHFDELCVFYSRYDRISSQHNELSNFTWQKIKYLTDLYPWIKVRRVDYADYFLKWDTLVKDAGYSSNLMDAFGISLPINPLINDLMFKFIDDYQALLKKGKKVSWVWGVDKPCLRYLDNKWIFNFLDHMIQWNISPMRQTLDDGTIGNIEFFYWSPEAECANIIIKQCHLLKKQYDAQAQLDFSKIPGAKKFKDNFGYEIDKMNENFVKTIYPRDFKFKEKFFTLKNTHLRGDRDNWFFESNHDKAKLHFDLFNSLKSKTYDHYKSWYKDKNSIDSGFIGAISRDYLI